MTISRTILMLGALLCAAIHPVDAGGRDDGVDWMIARSGRAWSFPKDHRAHPGFRTEWWYFTGHLSCDDSPERRFGYQFTLFRIGLLRDAPELDSDWDAASLIMGHAAITDLARGEHRFTDLLYRESPHLGSFPRPPDLQIGWVRPPAGTGAPWTLRFDDAAFQIAMRDDARGMDLQLILQPAKPIVLHGAGGLSRKGREPGAASHYYSITRLQTGGSLRLGQVDCPVSNAMTWVWAVPHFADIGEDWSPDLAHIGPHVIDAAPEKERERA